MRGKNNAPLPFRRRTTPLGHRQEFARLAKRLAEERAASQSVEQILDASEKLHELVEHPALQTIGALERMGQIFTAMLPRNPERAHALAQLGVSIAETLPSNVYPPVTVAQAKAFAWKDVGTALRFLGRQQESIDALLTAEAAVKPFDGLPHDLAIMRFSLAVTYQEVDRFEDSRQILGECRTVFRDHGDQMRYVLCAFAEGVLLQRLNAFREAREVYLLLLASPKAINEDSLAAIHRAIGLCSVELEDFHEAETHILRSIELNDLLGQRLESLKGQTVLGRLFIRRGDAREAVEYLRPVRREFLKSGLTEEAGICGLEIVAGLLALKRPEQAETLARTITLEFSTAGLNKRAVEAVGYLTEAITARTASTPLITRVRDYIVSLRTSPERDFALT